MYYLLPSFSPCLLFCFFCVVVFLLLVTRLLWAKHSRLNSRFSWDGVGSGGRVLTSGLPHFSFSTSLYVCLSASSFCTITFFSLIYRRLSTLKFVFLLFVLSVNRFCFFFFCCYKIYNFQSIVFSKYCFLD